MHGILRILQLRYACNWRRLLLAFVASPVTRNRGLQIEIKIGERRKSISNARAVLCALFVFFGRSLQLQDL